MSFFQPNQCWSTPLLIIFLLLFNYSSNQNSPKSRKDDLWFLEQPPWPPMPFSFGYRVRDLQGNEQYRKESSDGQKVTGSYGFWGPDGLFRHVDYVADDFGFRANVRTSEPGVENKDSADAKYSVFPLQYQPPNLPGIPQVNLPVSRNPYSLPPSSGHHSRPSSASGGTRRATTSRVAIGSSDDKSVTESVNNGRSSGDSPGGRGSSGRSAERSHLPPSPYELLPDFGSPLDGDGHSLTGHNDRSSVFYSPESDSKGSNKSRQDDLKEAIGKSSPLSKTSRLGLDVDQKELIDGRVNSFNPRGKTFSENLNPYPVPPPSSRTSKTRSGSNGPPYDEPKIRSKTNDRRFGFYDFPRNKPFPNRQTAVSVDHDRQAKIDDVGKSEFDVPSGRPRISSSGQGSFQERHDHGNIDNSVTKSYYPAARREEGKSNQDRSGGSVADEQRESPLNPPDDEKKNVKFFPKTGPSFGPEDEQSTAVRFDDDTQSSQSDTRELSSFPFEESSRPLMDHFVKPISMLYTNRMVDLRNRISLPEIRETKKLLSDQVNLPKVAEETLYAFGSNMTNRTSTEVKRAARSGPNPIADIGLRKRILTPAVRFADAGSDGDQTTLSSLLLPNLTSKSLSTNGESFSRPVNLVKIRNPAKDEPDSLNRKWFTLESRIDDLLAREGSHKRS